jgi:hypothetical protein
MALFHPMAFCVIHGVFAVGTSFEMKSGATVKFINCVFNCPVCGALSEILPGSYEVRADRLNFLIDSSISSAALLAIRDLAIAASSGHMSTAKAKKEAEKIHPKTSEGDILCGDHCRYGCYCRGTHDTVTNSNSQRQPNGRGTFY